MKRLFALATTACLLTQTSLSAQDVEVTVLPKNQIMVSAPTGGTPDAETRNKLKQHVTCIFEETDLNEVVTWLHKNTNLNIVVSPDIEPTNITFRAEDMKLESALSWIAQLSGAKVSYLHEAIYLSTESRPGPRSVKIYDVSDIALSVPHMPGPQISLQPAERRTTLIFPELDREQEVQRPTTEELAELIEDHLNR